MAPGALDSAMQGLAKTLVGVFGNERGSLIRKATATYDPLTGVDSIAADVAYAVTLSPPEQFKADRVNGTTIFTGDFLVTMAVKDALVVPNEETDHIRLDTSGDSAVYRIVSIDKVMSGREIAAWTLHCRK